MEELTTPCSEVMEEAPAASSLVSLCLDLVAAELTTGNVGDEFPGVLYELPSELLDSLLPRLNPLALELLHRSMPLHGPQDDCSRTQRKRKRWSNFDSAWETLFQTRWPDSATKSFCTHWPTGKGEVKDEVVCDWLQLYWETHLQECVDAVAEIASLPSFIGSVGLVETPASISKHIVNHRYPRNILSNYFKFSYHCQRFGSYARCLKFSSSLCAPEICDLLRNANLEKLEIQWIKSTQHVDALCALLKQNCKTLESVGLIHCKLSARYIDQICDSLWIKDLNTHRIQHFSIKLSSFVTSSFILPVSLASFISSGRSLSSLSLCGDSLRKDFVKMVIDTLFDASSNIDTLDLSDNYISGFLSHFKPPLNRTQLSSGTDKSLQLLRVLNLRNNNLEEDDLVNLIYALTHIPKLESLDLSDNPIEDGIMVMVPYFMEMSEKPSVLDSLKLENCELTFNGVNQLLKTLSTWKKPLRSLSLRENYIGREFGTLLGKFLQKGIQSLDIDDTGLEAFGFKEAKEEITGDLKLVYINISKNRGGLETAEFLAKLISCAPEIVEIDATYNFMPVESLSILSSALKAMKGKLERLDLTGNAVQITVDASVLAELQSNEKCTVKLGGWYPSEPRDDEP